MIDYRYSSLEIKNNKSNKNLKYIKQNLKNKKIMKTKIVLSITMLALIFNTYANDAISMDSIRYAIDHPDKSVEIGSETVVAFSDNMLWKTTYTKRYICKNCRISYETIPPVTVLHHDGIILFIISIFLSIAGGSGFYRITDIFRCIVLLIPLLVVCAPIFKNGNEGWWISIVMAICFIAAGWLGYHQMKRISKKEENRNPLGCI